MKRALLISFLGLQLTAAAGLIPDSCATNAIVGEAAGAPYAVKLAVAAALRNRGTLRGVYGFKSKVTRNSAPAVWSEARRAWRESARTDVTHGATHFGSASDVANPNAPITDLNHFA